MPNHKQAVFTMLLIFPLISVAHGFTNEMFAWSIIALSTTITFSQALFISLLGWFKLFKYRWLMVSSSVMSSLNVLAWILSLVGFTSAVSDLIQDSKATALIAFALVTLNLIILVWTFKYPKNQYHQINEIDKDE